MNKKTILTSLILCSLFINTANAQVSDDLNNSTYQNKETNSQPYSNNSTYTRDEILRANGFVPKSEMKFPKEFRPIDDFDSVSNNLIELYISNFSISRNMNGITSCTMDFHLNNDSNDVISLLSYKIEWEGLKTSLNFRNALPRQDKFQKYTLLGEGCYNADKIPNIVINRCRVKGISQDACANRIRWKKNK